jgi:uncharacterized protein (TIGR02246 family)
MPPVLRSSVISSMVIYMTFVVTLQSQTAKKGLPSDDSASVRAVVERYRAAWLANDENGVLSTFVSDAVLMPADGNPAVVGMPAIKKYWWPDSATKTAITKFAQIPDEVGGNEGLAYARGTSDVEWRSEDKGVAQDWQNSSSFLFLLRRDDRGAWQISHLIWDAGENKLLK